jgi:hypothetical protein
LHKLRALRQAAAGNIAIDATIGMLIALLQRQLLGQRRGRCRKLRMIGHVTGWNILE